MRTIMLDHEYELETVNRDAELPVGDWYVTCRDGRRVGFLLGSYEDYMEAVNNVDRGKHLAYDADDWAWFYEFGVSRLPRGTKCKAVFGR